MTLVNTSPAGNSKDAGAGHRVRVVAARFPRIAAKVRRAISALAGEIRNSEPRIDEIAPFGPGVQPGSGRKPVILFGDTGEIPLLAEAGPTRYDYRIGWLAGPGDLVVVGGPKSPAFEDYQRRVLNCPQIRYLNVDPTSREPRRATPAICLQDGPCYQQLLAATKAGRGATLMAHITTGTVWALASRLARDTGLPIDVAGPPPLLSRRVNDKLWFGDVSARLLGSGSVPPKRAAHSASALTRHVAELAQKWDQLVVKVPDSAGSAGNLVLASAGLRTLSAASLYDRLTRKMSVLGWRAHYPVAVEVWDTNVLMSPSVQTWIPRPETGLPVIEGIYEQILVGGEGAFAGAVEADLPDRLDRALTMGAMQLAVLFQDLGYYGRCSYDALLAGNRIENAVLHWVECNGRWGGVSIPMALVNRLAAAGPRPSHAIVQNETLAARPRPFDAALRDFTGFELRPDLKSGIVFLSPNWIEQGSGSHFLSFGPTREAAVVQSRGVLKLLS